MFFLQYWFGEEKRLRTTALGKLNTVFYLKKIIIKLMQYKETSQQAYLFYLFYMYFIIYLFFTW